MRRANRQSLSADTSEAAVLRSYERHLLFDKVTDPSSSTSRDKFEAFARSVRDLLARRWLPRSTFACTNHTLLPEALEKWPVVWFELLMPRLLEIIFEINRRFLQSVRIRVPADEGLVAGVSLTEEGASKQVRMANPAIVGSHSSSSDSNEALASLLATATVVLDTDRRSAKRCIQRAAALLGIDLSSGRHVAAEYAGLQGGLAPWQTKRIRCYIEDKLDASIRATDLAGVVQLSTSHFFRAFRRTFGESPVAYIMERRIRRAQELMLTSRLPLSQVALECGMCDQAHFCRVFRRIVGINPNAWRRQSTVGLAPDSSVGGQIPVGTAR
jgi:AraC family transcriptional regulator